MESCYSSPAKRLRVSSTGRDAERRSSFSTRRLTGRKSLAKKSPGRDDDRCEKYRYRYGSKVRCVGERYSTCWDSRCRRRVSPSMLVDDDDVRVGAGNTCCDGEDCACCSAFGHREHFINEVRLFFYLFIFAIALIKKKKDSTGAI